MVIRLSILTVLLAGLLAATLPAHGGNYRGPGSATGVRGPNTGGASGVNPGVRGPTTGSRPIATSGGTGWQLWWEYNKDPYLRLKEAVHRPDSLTDDEQFYLGAGKSVNSSFAPSEDEKRDVILPALNRLLESSDNKDINTACLVAMAKIGKDHPEVSILEIFKERLRSGNQEIRETAALSLGISQRADALQALLHLANDSKAGRSLMRRSKVDDRTRAFAIYGLGLLAWNLESSRDKERVYLGLKSLLEDRKLEDRDMRVALVQALSLLNLDTSDSAQKRLLWQTLDSLWDFYEKSLGKGDQLIQSHVPGAIARMLGRGDSPMHARYKAALARELDRKRGRQNSIYQSAALALGKMVYPAEIHAEDAEFSKVLLKYAKRGKDEQARNFCMISLGEIGGLANRNELLRIHAKGKKATERPWAALGLGIMAFRNRTGGTVDTGIGEALLRGLNDVNNVDTRAANAVALGLTGYQKAAKDMRKYLEKHSREDMVAGYLCIGLALMDEKEALDQIRELVEKSVRRPYLLTQAAIAMGKLGDKEAMAQLNQILSTGAQNVAKMSAVATAYRFIGDKRAVKPLIEMMFDERKLTKISRAFVAAALGGIADKELFPWNAKIAIGCNYRAAVSTLTNGQTGILDIL
ncbi:MAG: HEAT repeat domain-containing protein [Planctomycetota bacterium]